MKKIKMFAAAAFVCAVGFAGYSVYDKVTMTDQQKIFQANLEALTSGEDGTNVATCYSDGWSSNSGFYLQCNIGTNPSTIYPCPSNETLMSPGTSSMCTK